MRRLLAVGCILGLCLVWTRLPLAVGRAGGFGRFAGQRPPLSPHEDTAATIDGAALKITYGRPSMRGRQIFGSLVPFDRVWCPGADECTRLTTNRDLQFAGLTLKAGEYSLWMLPTESTWTLIFNSDDHAFHTGRNPRRDVGKIQLEKQTLRAPVEQLTFSLEPNAAGKGGLLAMRWETTRVAAPFSVLASR
jgi:DUF2911 family protein